MPGPLPSYVPIAFTGDIVVVDAPPFPTSKDECKNGGWKNTVSSKTQGDCVGFVATGGKNRRAAPSAGGTDRGILGGRCRRKT